MSCLADNEDYLTLTVKYLFPTMCQRTQFVLAPNEWGQATRLSRGLEPTAHFARSDYPIEWDQPVEAFERLRSAIFYDEKAGDQPVAIFGYQHRAGIGCCLHPRSDIGCLPEYVSVLTGARANHHRTRIDADPRLEFRPPSLLVQFRYYIEDCQASTSGTFRIVVVCLGVTEKCHYAIPKVLGNGPAEATYRFRNGPMIAGHHFAPFFGIEPSGDLS
jgi:hypothetical protein